MPLEDVPEAPECSHRQPMCSRITRKPGPNQGRKFWVCAMAQRDQCKSFKWDSEWQQVLRIKRAQQPSTPRITKQMVLSTELLCIDPDPLFLVTVSPPSPPFVAAVKRCKNAVWNYDKKKWTVPLEQHSVLLQHQKRVCKVESILWCPKIIGF